MPESATEPLDPRTRKFLPSERSATDGPPPIAAPATPPRANVSAEPFTAEEPLARSENTLVPAASCEPVSL